MSDLELQELRRRAVDGEEHAVEAYKAALHRSGEVDYAIQVLADAGYEVSQASPALLATLMIPAMSEASVPGPLRVMNGMAFPVEVKVRRLAFPPVGEKKPVLERIYDTVYGPDHP